MKYVDFDLVLTPMGDGYRAEVLGAPGGPIRADFRLPFTEQEVKIFRLEAGQRRRGMRRMESSEMRAAREFGARLYDSIFAGDVREHFVRSLDEAEQASSGLRIRMHLSRAPELTGLPWEYLYEPTLGHFLSLSVGTPLVRYLDLPERIKPLPVKPPVYVLAVIASPKDKPPLDVEGEWNRLSSALSGLTASGMVELDRLPTASYAALLKALRRKPYNIFHFIGHGEFNDECNEGMLLFEDERGEGSPVSAQALGTLLHDRPSLRLAILNSCEGARTSASDPFSGTAQTLLQQGIPAVIAMQAAISDEAAQTLAYTFYDAIADGYPVDAALTDARKSIYGEGSVEFGTPVLYMRSPDGRIFDVDRLSTEIHRREQRANLRREADEAVAAKTWTAAVERLEALLALEPGDAETAARLQHAKLHRNLAALLASARQHLDAGRDQEALEFLQQVVRLGGESPETTALIAAARGRLEAAERTPRSGAYSPIPEPGPSAERGRPKEWAGVVQVADLFHEGRQALAAEEWPKAVDRFRAVLERDPSHPAAREGLERAERERNLAGLYTRVQASLAARRWRDAVDDLRRIRDVDARYRDVEALLATATRELDTEEHDVFRRAPAAPPSPPSPMAAPARRKFPLWLKLAGGAVVAVGAVLFLVIVGLLVRKPSGDDGRGTVANPLPTIVAALDKPAAEPAPPPVRPPIEETLKSTVRAAAMAGIQAYHDVDVTPLQNYYAGEALETETGYLRALAASQKYANAVLGGQDFKGVQVSPDGQHAQVDVVETWSAELRWRNTGACFTRLSPYPMPQSYFLQRFGDRWLVMAVRRYAQVPPAQPCQD